MTLKGINLRSIVVAGFVGGYVMTQVDHYLAGMFGMFGMYPDDAWFFVRHHIDGILFAFLFAWPAVYLRLPGKGWAKGAAYGALLWLAVSVASGIAGAMGSFTFSQMPMTTGGLLSAVFLHVVYGFFVGAIYVTPPESNKPEEETFYMFTPRKRPDMVHHNS
ncbi:MAG: hypothetical protein HY961_10575 [Ignavibacteriae bacterium]|nr:hypothetical protein [Ignavibacteriota bacterium]